MGGLEVVDMLEFEVSEGCLIVVWWGSYKVSLGTGDGSGGGPSNAQVSNKVFGFESDSKSGVRNEPASFMRYRGSSL